MNKIFGVKGLFFFASSLCFGGSEFEEPEAMPKPSEEVVSVQNYQSSYQIPKTCSKEENMTHGVELENVATKNKNVISFSGSFSKFVSILKDFPCRKKSDEYSCLQELLKAYPELSKAVDKQGWSLLHHAADARREDAIILLKKNGVNPNAKDVNGNTAMDLVVHKIVGKEYKEGDPMRDYLIGEAVLLCSIGIDTESKNPGMTSTENLLINAGCFDVLRALRMTCKRIEEARKFHSEKSENPNTFENAFEISEKSSELTEIEQPEPLQEMIPQKDRKRWSTLSKNRMQ